MGNQHMEKGTAWPPCITKVLVLILNAYCLTSVTCQRSGKFRRFLDYLMDLA